MLLVKAYSNVAVSQQQLGHNPEEVLKAYETALRLARMEFGRDHPITKEVDAVYSEHLGTEAVRKATRRPQQGAAPAKVCFLFVGSYSHDMGITPGGATPPPPP